MLLLLGLATACPGDDSGENGGPEPHFPEDYAASYREVRDCRGSGDHDLHNIRILADPAAITPYENRTDPFPEGAVVLKEEYDFGDLACEGEVVQWTVMQRLASGSSPSTLDWAWQQIDFDRRVVAEDLPRCIQCHQACDAPPDGYTSTCAMP
jgi:hypothetical protein